jgi:gamma-glutamyltranspeptidase/glutathione hydrolase
VAIATAHPLATQAGLEIFRQGGNAFDAAVAITAALAVVEPYSSGLGGGGFWLLHRAEDGKQVMIDGRETAPAAANSAMYLDKNGKVKPGATLNGPLAAAIPGLPAGLVHLNEKYGRLTLIQNLAPAIRYASEGFPVSEHYGQMAGFRLKTLRASKEAARIFLHDNAAPTAGYKIIQADLARTLKLIAERGRAGFYSGKVAEQLVEEVTNHGGIWSLKDLADYHVIERPPIVTRYHDIQVISAAPPSSGGLVLSQILKMLEGFDLEHFDSVTRKHIIIETMRRAYRDRAAYLGDPDFVTIPTERLLDHDYIEGLAMSINLDHATPSEELGVMPANDPVGANTTHFSVLDSEGNRVAATLSINLPFGSGSVAAGTGVLLNDEMDDFAVEPMQPNAYGLVGDEANSIAPGKRPLSSMTPTFLETEDRVAILGTPGGSRIISMVLLGVLDFAAGNLPHSWVSLPRYHHQYLPDEVKFEQGGLTSLERTGLQNLGHHLTEENRKYGNMQAILWYKPKNLVFAASDPRGEGEAVVSTIIRADK